MYLRLIRGPRMDNRRGGGRCEKGWRRASEAIFYGYQLLLHETFRTSLKVGMFVVLSVMRERHLRYLIGLRPSIVLGICTYHVRIWLSFRDLVRNFLYSTIQFRKFFLNLGAWLKGVQAAISKSGTKRIYKNSKHN